MYAGIGEEKVESRAVILEVGAEHAGDVMKSLSTNFGNYFKDITFISFLKTDGDYNMVMRNALVEQNKMLHQVKRINIQGMINSEIMLTMKDGKVTSVRDWLMTARTESQKGPII